MIAWFDLFDLLRGGGVLGSCSLQPKNQSVLFLFLLVLCSLDHVSAECNVYNQGADCAGWTAGWTSTYGDCNACKPGKGKCSKNHYDSCDVSFHFCIQQNIYFKKFITLILVLSLPTLPFHFHRPVPRVNIRHKPHLLAANHAQVVITRVPQEDHPVTHVLLGKILILIKLGAIHVQRENMTVEIAAHIAIQDSGPVLHPLLAFNVTQVKNLILAILVVTIAP